MLMRILSDPLAVVLVLVFFGASIFVHEYGHYLAARWRKLKIERFSIGFGPRLFGWKDRHGVDWRVSLFPLGGYVALPQLADMRGIEGSSEDDPAALPSLSYSDKMIVAGAGAFFNIIFALSIATVLWLTGLPTSQSLETTRIGMVTTTLTDHEGMLRDGPAQRAGILPGDRIIRVDGKSVEDWEDVVYAITTGVERSPSGNPLTRLALERDGEVVNATVYPVLDEFENIRRIGITPASRLIVGKALPHSPAASAGLREDDEIIKLNGQGIYHTAQLSQYIQEQPTEPIELTVLRGDAEEQVSLLPEPVVYNTAGDTLPMIGVQWKPLQAVQHINPFTQVSEAVSMTFRILVALLHPRSDVGINNLSGPVGIGYTLYVISQIGLLEVLSIVVLINVNLAILNLLPIPVLDGGHMAFATIAKLRGQPVSPKFVASAQGLFMLLFLMIFVYVTFFDIGRVSRNESAISEAEQSIEQRVPIEFKGNPQTPEQ
jgi:regulator of sigma E protease